MVDRSLLADCDDDEETYPSVPSRNRESQERSNFIVNPPITKAHLICTDAAAVVVVASVQLRLHLLLIFHCQLPSRAHPIRRL